MTALPSITGRGFTSELTPVVIMKHRVLTIHVDVCKRGAQDCTGDAAHMERFNLVSQSASCAEGALTSSDKAIVHDRRNALITGT